MALRLSGHAVTMLALSFVSVVGCGGAVVTTSASDPASAAPSATPAGTITPASTPSGAVWTVTSASKATVRVREQLVALSFPSDAVLVATGAAGSFQLRDDGSFSPDSKISFDLTTLRSDESQRDNFVKQDTLSVRRFPRADFVPTKVSGLTLPLASSGDLSFKLTGKMTLHGTEKEVTFDVQANRDGSDLVATATANPSLKFADFGMSAPSVPFRVVSVVDEIRLVIDLVATGPRS